MIWRVCPICGVRCLVRPTQHTCSRRCGAVLVKRRWGMAWHAENGAKAGRSSSAAQADRTIASWLQRYPGITEEAIRKIRAQGYSAGWQMGKRAGLRAALLREGVA